MDILLTGGTGFLGSHLVKSFLNTGHRVIVLKRSTSNLRRLENVKERVKFYDVDKHNIRKAFEDNNIKVIVHTACVYGRRNETLKEVVETNVVFGIKLLDLALEFNTDTFFNTDTQLPKYLNVYSTSKKQFVEWLKLNSEKIQVVNLKIEQMFGEFDDKTKFATWIFSELKNNVQTIDLTEGLQKRDFVYVQDVVSAYNICLNNRTKLNQFNDIDVGTGDLTTVREFLELLKGTFEENINKVNTVLNFGVVPYREGEIMEPKIDVSKLKKMGWKPQNTLEENIKSFVINESREI